VVPPTFLVFSSISARAGNIATTAAAENSAIHFDHGCFIQEASLLRKQQTSILSKISAQ
jgi:hypothetical protein